MLDQRNTKKEKQNCDENALSASLCQKHDVIVSKGQPDGQTHRINMPQTIQP